MQKPKESAFADKFRLLNSQEHAEEINWSSSESSEFENVSNGDRLCSMSIKLRNSKRKRKKVLNNISNLDFTIVDAPKSHEKVSREIESPTFVEKSTLTSRETSPVLTRTGQYFPPYKCSKIAATSPILKSKGCLQQAKLDLSIKSPILTLKYASPKASVKVKKNLFKSEKSCEVLDEKVAKGKRQTILLDIQEDFKHLDRRKEAINSKHRLIDKISRNVTSEGIKINKKSSEESPNLSVDKPENELTKEIEQQEKTVDSTLDDSYDTLKTTSFNLARKIKSYFDSHFSSENNSQQSISISESLTPNHSSKTSDEIEITSSITQVNSPRLSSLEPELASNHVSPASSESAEINLGKHKKVRYKKNGLAYRLNALVKKQNANISLWQHERFLADNSNFLIPKGEHVVFRIQRVSFKYGCYILNAVNMDEEEFLILINNIYVSDFKFVTDAVFKLYEPYKIINFDRDFKLIINVCKFECITF